MPRRPQPWRRGGSGGPWYAQVKGKQIFLAGPDATKTEAHAVLDGLRTETARQPPGRPRGLTFHECINLFLAYVEGAVGRKEKKPLTLEGYRRFLLPAIDSFGKHPVAALKPLHVSLWLDAPREKPWNTTTRNNAITAVKAALNWAKREGHIPENPVKDMAKPKARVTEGDMTEATALRLIAAAHDRPFRDFMEVMFATGARPSEVMAVEKRHVDFAAGLIVMDGKTTGRTGQDRFIVVGAARGILDRLARLHPDGPLLRNARGTPWTRHTIAHRFGRLRKRLGMGKEATAKGFRHGFATDGLVKGVSSAAMAELLGHKSTKMLDKHYSKVRKRLEHLKGEAGKVRPEPKGSSGDAEP